MARVSLSALPPHCFLLLGLLAPPSFLRLSSSPLPQLIPLHRSSPLPPPPQPHALTTVTPTLISTLPPLTCPLYPLPRFLNSTLCFLNTIFIAIKAQPSSAPLLGAFASIFIPATLICTYDSFRPRPSALGLGRLASAFLLLGQCVTAGLAMPLYYACYFASPRPGRQTAGERPGTEYAWTALLSTVLGMLVPSLIMDRAGWSYGALALWQPFPVYMLILNLVLPPVLRALGVGSSPSSPSSSGAPSSSPAGSPRLPATPILIGATISTALSLKEHFGLLTSRSIRAALLPPFRGQGFGAAGHALFAGDCGFIYLTMALRLVLALPREKRGKAVGALVVGTVVGGPGAALAGLWVWSEGL